MADLGDAVVNGNSVPRSLSNAPKKLETSITTSPIDFGLQSPKDELLSVGLVELLDIDDRPVFVLDLASSSKAIPVYCNACLREIPLLELKIGKGVVPGGKTERDPKYAAFIEWAGATTKLGSFPETNYWGLRWKAKTIRKRWRIVSGEEGDHIEDAAALRRQSEFPRPGRSQTMDKVERRSRELSKPAVTPNDYLEAQLSAFRLRREEEIQVFPSQAPREQVQRQDSKDSKENISNAEDIGRIDFTKPNPSFALSPHHEFVLNFNWGSTELGPINQWSTELRRMANILMSDPRPAAMYWGKHRTIMYNEPYVVVMGQKHPGMMGNTFSQAWAEVESDFSPAFDIASETGTPYLVNDARFYIDRQGYLEETYYSISIIPFSVDDGGVGFYNPVSDSTRQVIADRRMAFLLRLGQYIASSQEPKDFWAQLLLALQGDHLDLPFSIVYSAGGDINETLSESSELRANLRNWTLEGLVKVPQTLTSIPKRINTEQAMEEFLPDFFELVKQDTPTLLQADTGTLPEFISKEIIITMDGEHPCRSAIFLPIRSTADNVLGFMILGVNPRRQFDADYKVFIELLSRQLATSMASALLFEEEIRRGQMAAEQATHDRNLLSKKLAIQTHEALEVEARFRRMADLAPVGMFHIDLQGVLLYANEEYYAMTGHPRDVSTPMSWYNVLYDADHPIMDREWGKLLGGATVSFELRLKSPFVAEEIVPGEKVEGFTWIIAAAYPERNVHGSVIGILGCITDISRQKWMEGFQTRKMMEAVELKRQQENFIDMTSHEMRNPLSAIIQCGDWIGTSLSEFGGESQNVTIPRELVDGYADAAQTIVLCAQHQKRIIDDILTLSKLDSDLLFVTPVEVQPISVIRMALKMFDSELQKSHMELRLHVDPSYSKLAVDWVRLDPSRLLQVLINLTTNAIKFTQTETKRRISISIGASTDPPPGRNGIEYLPRSSNRKDLSLGTAWGTGEIVYLYVEVEDTGRGLDEVERNLLFRRFSQASPRTHVQYGGSGLGLFISRELTELQGGQIGVASKAGVGSTFSFYVRARRCDPPDDHKPINPYPVDMKAQSKIISPAALARLQSGSGFPNSESKAPQPVVPKHVLIVEDNIVNQKVLSKQLRSAGCTVHVANHGGEALSFLSTTRFWAGNENTGLLLHIILMDLEMPVMDGLTCVKRIRELQREGVITRHIPVIAVTANARSEQIATAKESGMDSVVTKPFRIPELLPEMERQVRRGEVRPVELERASSAPA